MIVRFNVAVIGLALALTTSLPSVAQAQKMVRKVTAGGFMQLPYSVTDSVGNQWTIYQNGMLQQRGNTPVYGQGAMLLINGENVQMNVNRARQDDKTGEVVFENGVAANVAI